jgi:hypothetical protein
VFRGAGPNFERPLLRAICFFCGVLKKGYSIPRGGSTAAVSGRTGEVCGLWACCKIQLENHQQLVNQIKNKNKKQNKSQCQHCLVTLADEAGARESWR